MLNMFIFYRFVLLGRMANQSCDRRTITNINKLTSPNTINNDSSLQVSPPNVSSASVDIYKQYVAKSNGIVQVEDNKYKRYLDCELGLFRPLGWD